METKIWGFQNPKPRIEGGGGATTRPSTPLPLSAGLYGPGPRRQGIGSASLRALDGCGPSLGDSLFMRERGELQTGGRESTRKMLHKGAVLQPPGPGRAFKGLGVAKRYCRRKVNGDRFPHGLRDTLETACPTGL